MMGSKWHFPFATFNMILISNGGDSTGAQQRGPTGVRQAPPSWPTPTPVGRLVVCGWWCCASSSWTPWNPSWPPGLGRLGRDDLGGFLIKWFRKPYETMLETAQRSGLILVQYFKPEFQAEFPLDITPLREPAKIMKHPETGHVIFLPILATDGTFHQSSMRRQATRWDLIFFLVLGCGSIDLKENLWETMVLSWETGVEVGPGSAGNS